MAVAVAVAVAGCAFVFGAAAPGVTSQLLPLGVHCVGVDRLIGGWRCILGGGQERLKAGEGIEGHGLVAIVIRRVANVGRVAVWNGQGGKRLSSLDQLWILLSRPFTVIIIVVVIIIVIAIVPLSAAAAALCGAVFLSRAEPIDQSPQAKSKRRLPPKSAREQNKSNQRSTMVCVCVCMSE